MQPDQISIEDLIKENKALKRKLSLMELNQIKAQKVYGAQNRVEAIFSDSVKKGERFFRLVLENVTNLLLLLDFDGRFAYASNTFLETTEIKSFGLINGRDYRDVLQQHISGDIVKKISTGVYRAITEKEIITFQEQIDFNFKKEPRIYTISILSMNYDDMHTGTMMLFNDITDINNALKSAEYANQAKSNFLATMSHEIRTPLNAIMGIVHILFQKDYLNQDLINALERINISSENLLGIINDILDLTKIETGKMELNPIEYDIPSLINDTVQLNVVRIGDKPIDFILDIDEDLPLKLIGDELRLKQILNNLLSNAIKYTKNGFVKLTVKHSPLSQEGIEVGCNNVTQASSSCSDEEKEIYLKFIVEDTGQGIKPEDQKNLFKEYIRFNTELNTSTEGTGIGLKITQNLVELMNGKIIVQSDYDIGSTFTAIVRQKLVTSEILGKKLAENLCNFSYIGERQASGKQFLREPMPYGSVLIVDDMETNLYVAEGLLTPYRLKIDKAINAFIAIEKIKIGAKYDVVFMDHMMPGMDGIQATKKLRSMGYKGVIIALTANALAGNDDIFLQNGFDGFISKPIDVKHLDNELNKHIRDKYPEEAKKYKEMMLLEEVTKEDVIPSQVNVAPSSDGHIDPKLLKIFCIDAQKAIETMQASLQNGDTKLFTTNAHAMKTILASIGEYEKSKLAADLETAGLKNNLDFIKTQTDSFVKQINALLNSLKSIDEKGEQNECIPKNDIDITEDIDFLCQKLKEIIKACHEYDDTAINNILNLVKEKSWKSDNDIAIEKIHDLFYLHSDFDSVAEQAQALQDRLI